MSQEQFLKSENIKEDLGILEMSDEQLEEIWGNARSNMGSMRSWFKEKGYDVDLRFYFPSMMGTRFEQAVEYVRKVGEIIKAVGIDKLDGKSFELIPRDSNVGQILNPVSQLPQLQIGLDAPLHIIVETIKKEVVKD